jgi:hypothetical protein
VTKSQAFILTFASLLLCSGFTAHNLLAQRPKSRRAKPAAKPPVELVAELEPQSSAANWKLFTSPEGRFSILTPGEFKYTKPVAQTPDGPIQMHVFNYFANAEYSVTYADYLAVIERSERLTPFLDGVRDSGIAGIKGRLLEEKDITFDGHPGRSYRIEYGTDYNSLLLGRNVVVGQRLYIVAATYARKSVAVADGSYEQWALKYLDSFKLVNPAND